MDDHVRRLLAATRLHVAEVDYVLVRAPSTAYAAFLSALAASQPTSCVGVVWSSAEMTGLLPVETWGEIAATFPAATVELGWRLITLEQTIDLAVSGYLAPLAQALAARAIPLLVLSAFSTDHLLVHATDLDAALVALQEVIDRAGRGEGLRMPS